MPFWWIVSWLLLLSIQTHFHADIETQHLPPLSYILMIWAKVFSLQVLCSIKRSDNLCSQKRLLFVRLLKTRLQSCTMSGFGLVNFMSSWSRKKQRLSEAVGSFFFKVRVLKELSPGNVITAKPSESQAFNQPLCRATDNKRLPRQTANVEYVITLRLHCGFDEN